MARQRTKSKLPDSFTTPGWDQYASNEQGMSRANQRTQAINAKGDSVGNSGKLGEAGPGGTPSADGGVKIVGGGSKRSGRR